MQDQRLNIKQFHFFYKNNSAKNLNYNLDRLFFVVKLDCAYFSKYELEKSRVILIFVDLNNIV